MKTETKRLPVGNVVGEYEIHGLLGEGSFGTVYAARHPVIGKRAAIKVLKHEAAADSQTAQRFKGEALAVNAIEHPNIVDIFGFGHLPDGRPYLIMEYLRGSSLEELLQNRDGRIPIPELLPILHSVARAVDAAHQAGVIHRDLKPDNIFVARPASGMQVVKVLDFGVAKLMFQDLGATQPGVPIGTPWYMAPEQCFGEHVDHRVDVYGYGVIAFRCLTGAFPVDGDTYADIMKCHRTGERALASEMDASLANYDEILYRCLNVIPDERFDSLEAVYEAILGAHRAGAQILAPEAVAANIKGDTLLGPQAANQATERPVADELSKEEHSLASTMLYKRASHRHMQAASDGDDVEEIAHLERASHNQSGLAPHVPA